MGAADGDVGEAILLAAPEQLLAHLVDAPYGSVRGCRQLLTTHSGFRHDSAGSDLGNSIDRDEVHGRLKFDLVEPVPRAIHDPRLLDVHSAYGLGAISQVDLGRRAHRHQSLHDLAAMATELLAVAERRRLGMPPNSSDLAGVSESAGTVALRLPTPDRAWTERAIPIAERPRAIDMGGYPV